MHDTRLDAIACDQYQDLMNDTRRRHEFLRRLDGAVAHDNHWLETAGLQVRMMLENIVYACLVANGQYFNSDEKVLRAWRPEQIVSSLDDRLPHDCWPVPLVLNEPPTSHDDNPMFRGELVVRPESDWLTKDECKAAHRELGELLHARNPLKQSSPSLDYFANALGGWVGKVAHLLMHHQIASSNEDRMWVVSINTDGTQITEFVALAKPS